MAHTAPTFASIMTLVTMNTREAFQVIHRGKLYRYLLSLKNQTDGSFHVHLDGECDTRAMYTVLAVASICNMLTPQLTVGCAEWIAKTQGFDGGMGGAPGNESHGGYAYCALASLVLLQAPPSTINLPAFTTWLFMRQMKIEGGFQGRTNKLVDSCYSFWQGGSFPLLQRFAPKEDFPPCDSKRLVEYVLKGCCHGNGGLKDKPDTRRDYYHTCYALSGVSVVLGGGGSDVKKQLPWLDETDPLYNVQVGKLGRTRVFFARLPCKHEELVGL